MSLALGGLIIALILISSMGYSLNLWYGIGSGVGICALGLLFRVISKHLFALGIIQLFTAVSVVAVVWNAPGTMDYLLIDFTLLGAALILFVTGIVVIIIGLVKYFREKRI